MTRAAALGVALAAACVVAAASARAEDFECERVFGPETPTGPYKHPSSFEELRNGDLYLAYYGGGGEYETETAVFGSRRARGSAAWTAPEPIARNPFRSVGNPVVWQAPDGVVWLFYVTRFGATWSTSRIKAKISTDEAHTWSDSVLLTLEAGSMVRGRPIVLSDGAYLLPIYQETGTDTERVGADSTGLFLRFDPATREWSETGRIHSPNGNIQPAVVELEPGHLLAFNRRGGGYGPEERGYIVRSESRDGGMTWSPGVDTEFPNPNAAVELIRLRNGHLLLVYNDSMSRRTPLTAAVSTDGGRTFPHRRNVREDDGSFAYPVALQGADGRIRLVFTSDGRSVVNLCSFDESAVLQE